MTAEDALLNNSAVSCTPRLGMDLAESKGHKLPASQTPVWQLPHQCVTGETHGGKTAKGRTCHMTQNTNAKSEHK